MIKKKYRAKGRAPATMIDAKIYKPVLRVSQKAIDDSKRNDTRWCMLSRGLAYTLRNSIRIYVDASVIRFSLGIYRYTYMTPTNVIKKIVDFDSGKTIKPFSVRLAKPVGIMPVHNSDPRSSNKKALPTKRTDGLVVANNPGGKKGVKWSATPNTPDRKKCTRRSSRRWHGLVVPSKKKAA